MPIGGEGMRALICVAVVVALVFVVGCAKTDTPPAEQGQSPSETQADPQPIASEDFESGEAPGAVQEDDGEAEGGEGETTP